MNLPRYRILTWIAASALAITAAAAAEPVVVVTNPTGDQWREAPVVVKWREGMPGKGAKGLLVGLYNTAEVPVQVDDLDADGTPDELVFLLDLGPEQTKRVTLTERPVAQPALFRAHAGMYLKTPEMRGMEGPGWESDLIAFRLYWDPRSPIDVFCKGQPILSLEQFAKATHDYHRNSKWGQDVLKVGTALGIGGFGVIENGKVAKASYTRRSHRVVATGPLRAAMDLVYDDWETSGRKLALTARVGAFAGQHWGYADLALKALDGKPLPELVTGVVKHPDTELISDRTAGVLGRWGRQALGDGEKPGDADLGLGVAVPPARIAAFGEDAVNSYAAITPGDGTASYRYMADWGREADPAKSATQFGDRLRAVARLQPVVEIVF